ncbi:NADP-dependent oxidoreductase [Chitinophaga alhagiae]|uniref:NADP-dependent oxidoreductase n=1 Tax=Chitinophaga alhagiae TaxID=2203219 RepID=UPI000E5C1CA9|nr:NADP-dependent oxidoreductase [Chitinophaga alhagiae]
MKAVAVTSFKAIPQLMDLPEPQVKEGQVLIQLAAAGLNPFDWKMIDGILEDHMPHVFPLIVGVDGAGIVAATGPGVTRFKKGDRVYGQMLHAPVGEGSYAEFVAVPEKAAIAIAPETLSLADAAAAPTAGMTALQLLDKLGLTAGQTLLLIGATGGVGAFVIQLAKARGLRVVASVSSSAGAERVKALGAESTVNYKENEAYPGHVDGLVDLVDQAAAFAEKITLVKPGGIVLTTQFVADKAALQAQQLRGGNFETKGTPASLDALRQAIDRGDIKIPVDRRVSLSQAPAAIAESRELKSKGKTIIVINDQL